MKKLTILLMLLPLIIINNVFAFFVPPPPCSFVSKSNTPNKYNDLNDFIRDRNNDIKDYWKDKIKPVIKDIKDESKNREKKLKKLKNIEKDRFLVNKEIEFILHQQNELLGNLINIEAEK